jgi:hypothetical protein
MRHFLPRTIPYGKGTRAYWAREPNGTLLLFVHGFNGKPVATWNEFPTLLQECPEGSGCDLLFYGYDSLYTRAVFSAAEFFKSLDALLTRTTDIVNRSLSFDARSPEFEYRRVVLIAHSLGAIVVRKALLEGVSRHKSWTSKITLALFAPAHLGADILTLLVQTHCLSGLLGLLIRYKIQTLFDLQPKCQTLTQLATDTLTALSSGTNDFLTAHVICFGDGDRVVDPNRFVNDPDPEIEWGKGHCDICKPSFTFKKPLDLICDCL